MNSLKGVWSLGTITRSTHWGQGVVYPAGTLQVHCKKMDKVPSMYPLGTSQVHSEFSQLISMQFPQPREWSVHSQCPRSCDSNFPIGN